MIRRQPGISVARVHRPAATPAVFGCVVTLLGTPLFAHPVYMEYIEHQVHVRVGPANIDITVELRFNEVQSLAQRRRMDGDRDGIISRPEQARYLRRMRRELADAFRLNCQGKPLDVIELYAPELDLLGAEGVSPTHHVLRLSYFARTPRPLALPAKLELEDAGWAGAPALWLFRGTGEPGVNLQTPPVPTTAPAEGESQRVGLVVIHSISSDPPPATRPADEPASSETSNEPRPAAIGKNSNQSHPSTE